MRVGSRPALDDSATVERLEDEIDYIQSTLTGALESHVRKITICAQSKRWWNEDIRSKRRQLGRVTLRRRAGRAS